MAASDYVSLAQHQMARKQRMRIASFKNKPERNQRRVRAARPSGMVGSMYPYRGEIAITPWGTWGIPELDAYGEQYGTFEDDYSGSPEGSSEE